MKILIIEDNHFIVGRILTKLSDIFQEGETGDLITVVPNLSQAEVIAKGYYSFEKPAELPFDILLIDHDLPDGNGTWFLKNYKKRFKHIIAISSIPENNKRLLENGAHNAVNKMDKDFLDKLSNILKERQ